MELPTTGKWYWECYGDANSTRFGLLMADRPGTTNPTPTTGGKIWYWDSNGVNYPYGTVVDGTAYTLGTICGIGVDVDAGEIKFYKNGVLLYTGTNLNSEGYEFLRPIFWHTDGSTIWANFGQDSTFAGTKAGGAAAQDANNVGDFYYAPPAGHLALCTKNLQTSTITDPSEHMNTVLYTGTGSPLNVGGVGFKPDLVWLKSRSAADSHILQDSVRGNWILSTDSQGAEGNTGGGWIRQPTLADGFTVDVNSPINTSGHNYVAWTWKGDTTPSITYTVTVAGSMDYYIDGFATAKPTMRLQKGGTYTFDESDSSNSSHLFAFSTTADGTFGGGSEYTTGVTHVGTPGQSGAYTRIVVDSGAPNQLYYYCVYHGSMGGDVTISVDASSSGSSNFQGTIASAVSANQIAGFSIVGWTGTGSNATVGHGLNQVPELLINKSRETAHNWAVQSIVWANASDTNILYLNTPAGQADDTNIFQAAPTASVFSPQGGAWAGIGVNNTNYIAYCFHSVEGYSKIATFNGNGNTNGPFVHTGFRPSWILIKETSDTSNWDIHDKRRPGYNIDNNQLSADENPAEKTNNYLEWFSNGFKIQTTDGGYNTSGNKYLYMAFAESPFKTSNAR